MYLPRGFWEMPVARAGPLSSVQGQQDTPAGVSAPSPFNTLTVRSQMGVGFRDSQGHSRAKAKRLPPSPLPVIPKPRHLLTFTVFTVHF